MMMKGSSDGSVLSFSISYPSLFRSLLGLKLQVVREQNHLQARHGALCFPSGDLTRQFEDEGWSWADGSAIMTSIFKAH